MLGMARAGVSPSDAAAAVGINRRTFRELRQRARGEHPTRRPTRQLVEFFNLVDQFQADARVHAQMRLHRDDAKTWLRLYGGTPDDDEWGSSGRPGAPGRHPNGVVHRPATAQQAAEVFDILIGAGAIKTPPCSNPECACEHHRGSASDDEPDRS
jgi:hypothetical protein